MSDAEKCDREVFERGDAICTFAASQRITEEWVQKVAIESGQRVDWHYSGGRVNVLFLGDYDAVKRACVKLLPELRAKCEEMDPEYGLCAWSFSPQKSRGLYRRGDPL